MKTKINNSPAANLSIKLLALVFFTFFAGGHAFAQKASNNDVTTQAIIICKFEKFTAKPVDGKVYLTWTLVSSTDNRFFVIERSNNGSDYKAIAMKKVAVSPNNIALLYSFIDEGSMSSNVNYRISVLENNGQIIASIDSENTYSSNKMIIQGVAMVQK